MGVRVDEPGNQDVLVEPDCRVVVETLARLGRRQQRFYLAVANCDGVVGEYAARRLDRDEPAGKRQKAVSEAFPYRGVPWISTTTRRLGARQLIS